MRVPVFKEEPVYDDPLSTSTAKPCDRYKMSKIKPVAVVEGQHLVGDMIPRQ